MFTIGDEVTITKDLANLYRENKDLDIVDSMLNYAGMSATVMEAIVGLGRNIEEYQGYYLDISTHIWHIDLLSPEPYYEEEEDWREQYYRWKSQQ